MNSLSEDRREIRLDFLDFSLVFPPNQDFISESEFFKENPQLFYFYHS